MIGAENSYLIGNIVMTVGTLLLVRSVLKNTKLLHGYDLFGSIITFIGLLFFLNGYLETAQYFTVVFVLVTVAYWGIVVIFKLKYRKK